VADSAPTSPEGTLLPPERPWQLAAAGLLLVALSHPYVWHPGQTALWFAPLGLGLALTAWLGFRAVPGIVAALAAVQVLLRPESTSLVQALVAAVLTGAEIAIAWWCYHVKGGGARRLDDPRSATLFLLLVPGAAAGLFAVPQALNQADWVVSDQFWPLVLNVWLARALGVVSLAPPLLVEATPWLVHYGLARGGAEERRFRLHPRLSWTTGQLLQTLGLAAGAGIVGLVLARLHAGTASTNWHLWGVLLLVTVWASLQQGLRGGTLTAATATVLGLLLAASLSADDLLLAPLRGNLLAQCCAAVLVGASADWIRASEARYRQVVGHIPAVLYSARYLRRPGPGAEIEVLLVSAAARTILGRDPETLTGSYERWLALIHPADRELVQAALAQLLLQNQPVTCEYRLAEVPAAAPPSGQAANPVAALGRVPGVPQRWVRDTLAPHHDPDGRLDGWEGVVEDITEQRALATDLRRASTMLHALVAHLPTGVFFVHGKQGLPLLVNARARQLLGQREDLAAGVSHLSTVYRLHRPDGTPYPWEELPVYKALRFGAAGMRDDIVVHRPDGRKIPLVTWAAPVNLGTEGEADAAVWVLEDLTALRQAEERYRVLVETLPLMLLQFDAKGALTFHNPAAESITGYLADVLTEPGFWRSCVHADDWPALAGLLEAAGGGQAGRAEFRYRAANGAEQVGYALAQPRRPGGATLLVVDMTPHRRMERELQKVQRLELVGRIAGGVVHDFNNFLTVILSYAELARQSLGGHAVARDLEKVTEAAEGAARLAGQLLAFSRQRQVVMRPVDVCAAVERSVALLRPTLPFNLAVEVEAAPGPLEVMADEAPLQQVLMNLLLNARDAMPEGGRIRVAAAAVALTAGDSTVAAAPGASGGVREWVRLSVADSGCGMDAEVQARIFEPLFTTKERGSGLGLAVVKQIVEGFGGCIQVDSAPGRGARFDVWLPARVS
jgi:PAS domain S-box-containing protein